MPSNWYNACVKATVSELYSRCNLQVAIISLWQVRSGRSLAGVNGAVSISSPYLHFEMNVLLCNHRNYCNNHFGEHFLLANWCWRRCMLCNEVLTVLAQHAFYHFLRPELAICLQGSKYDLNGNWAMKCCRTQPDRFIVWQMEQSSTSLWVWPFVCFLIDPPNDWQRRKYL